MKSSAQPSKNRIVHRCFLLSISIIIIAFLFIFLHSRSNLFFYFLLLFISLGFSFYFWLSFIPFFPDSLVNFLNLLQTIMLSFFRRTNSTYHIQAGKFNKDYFVIQDKPQLDALLIGENSKVIVINNVGRKRVVPPGYQFINKKEQVLHTFDLLSHHFYWGPLKTLKSERNHIPDIDLNHAHLLTLKIAQTKWQTKNRITIIPLFSIFYNFSTNADEKQLDNLSLKISDYFSDRNTNGELQTEINQIIGVRVTHIWKTYLENSSSKEILTLTDHNSSLRKKLMVDINTIINKKITVGISGSDKFVEPNLLADINPLDHWELLNIKAFLNNLWIQQEVPKL